MDEVHSYADSLGEDIPSSIAKEMLRSWDAWLMMMALCLHAMPYVMCTWLVFLWIIKVNAYKYAILQTCNNLDIIIVNDMSRLSLESHINFTCRRHDGDTIEVNYFIASQESILPSQIFIVSLWIPRLPLLLIPVLTSHPTLRPPFVRSVLTASVSWRNTLFAIWVGFQSCECLRVPCTSSKRLQYWFCFPLAEKLLAVVAFRRIIFLAR